MTPRLCDSLTTELQEFSFSFFYDFDKNFYEYKVPNFSIYEVWPQRSLIVTKVHLKIIFFDKVIKWSMTLKVIQGNIRSPLCQNHSSTFVYGPIWMKIYMNANIMKTKSFQYIWPKMHFYVMKFTWITFVLVLKWFRNNQNQGRWNESALRSRRFLTFKRGFYVAKNCPCC